MRIIMTKLHKSRYSVVQILGDYYYKDMPLEEAVQHAVKRVPSNIKMESEDDINKFIESTINEELPLNRPRWELWW